MILKDKKILVTGVLNPRSIAFSFARLAQEQGAEIVLTGFGKGMDLTEMTARRLPSTPDVLEMDVSDDGQITAVVKEIGSLWSSLDGILHAVAFAPPDALGGEFLRTPWESVQVAFKTSAYSLKALAANFLPLMNERGGSVVALDFDASVAWPIYDWMGVAKAGLEAITRYLARDLGPHQIRVNCVSSGPIRTTAAKGIPGFEVLARAWARRAPLGWDNENPERVAGTIAFLMSDFSSGITGEIIHVDGGFHALGAEADGDVGEIAGNRPAGERALGRKG